MLSKNKIIHTICIAILGAVSITLGACGKSNDTATTPLTTTPISLTGSVIKGPYLSGNVDVYSISLNGIRILLQSFPNVVKTNGAFNIRLTKAPTGIIEIVVSGGSYIDETTGKIVTNATSLSSLLDTTSTVYKNNIINGQAAITPLTTFASRIAMAPGKVVNPYAVIMAQNNIQRQFGLVTPIVSTVPLVNNLPTNADHYALQAGMVVAGLAQLAKNLGLANANTLLIALDDDIEDGKFDGAAQGVTINFQNAGMPNNIGTTQYLNAINQVAASVPFSNQKGTEQLLQKIAAAIASGSATPPNIANQLAVSTSGSVINITDNKGNEKLIIAGGTSLKFVHLTKDNYGNPVAGVINVVSIISGANGVTGIPTTGEVMTYSYGNGVVTFVDSYTQTITKTLDTKIITTANFSGGSAVIAGAVFDGVNGVWLATGDGYFHINLQTKAIDKKYYTSAAMPVGQTATGVILSENFGADVTHGILLSAYGSGSISSGIQIIDTKKFDLNVANAGLFSMDASQFGILFQKGLSTPDASAIDSTTQFAIAMDENSTTATVMDVNAVIVDGYGNFTLPANSYSQTDLATGLSSLFPSRFTGAVIESSTHSIQFFEQGGSMVAVGTLSSTFPKITDWVIWNMNSVPQLASFWTNTMDPHGLVVTTLNGKTVGLLPNSSNTKVAVIDIAKMLAAPRVVQAGNVISHELDLVQLPIDSIIIMFTP